jgi:hypothetical protein
MFRQFRRLQAFELQHLPFIQSPLDSVLIAEVGFHEQQGHPLSIKGLLLLKLGAPATVHRRLARLVGLGVIHKRPVSHDRRICHLEIDPAVRATYVRYLKLMSRL